MALENNNQSSVSVGQQVIQADPFSCRNCAGYKAYQVCQDMRQANQCVKAALVDALQSGMVQVVLSLPGGEK